MRHAVYHLFPHKEFMLLYKIYYIIRQAVCYLSVVVKRGYYDVFQAFLHNTIVVCIRLKSVLLISVSL